jgi:small subunit ribosomal protein S20
MPKKKKKNPNIKKERKNFLRNRAVKNRLKSLIKKTKELALNKDQAYQELLKTTIKSIDKAAGKGIIHKKTAARKKSRLVTFLNKITVSV